MVYQCYFLLCIASELTIGIFYNQHPLIINHRAFRDYQPLLSAQITLRILPIPSANSRLNLTQRKCVSCLTTRSLWRKNTPSSLAQGLNTLLLPSPRRDQTMCLPSDRIRPGEDGVCFEIPLCGRAPNPVHRLRESERQPHGFPTVVR